MCSSDLTLSPEDAAQLRELFKQHDADGDNVITKNELQNLLVLHWKLTESDATKIISGSKRLQDAKMPLEEFMTFAAENAGVMAKAERDVGREESGTPAIYKCFALSCCLCTLCASWIPYWLHQRDVRKQRENALKNNLAPKEEKKS